MFCELIDDRVPFVDAFILQECCRYVYGWDGYVRSLHQRKRSDEPHIFSCYASTSKAKEDSLPSGYRKTPPFAFFLKENYAKKDGVKVTEAMVELKNRWNSLSAIEKKVGHWQQLHLLLSADRAAQTNMHMHLYLIQKYFDESAAELKEKKAKFDALGVEEKQRLREESERNREKRVRRRIRAEKAAKREESHRPVRPPSAYNLYIKEKMGMAQRTPEQQRLKFKEFAAAWKTLPEKEKQVSSFKYILRSIEENSIT
ncbi:unnamed protein product [Toxocara canis]|uniref:HMG box domain-containing protein n=1 Tax=Toxocara canis TaxID=6265 RepID=A0A183UPI9_TOXCA|nr:unnamed protein product [Toxocara canis]